MNQQEKTFSLSLSVTAPYPCSYLENRTACSQIVSPAHIVKTPIYEQLIQQGFRRSGQFTYRPHCDECQACTSIRVPVASFVPNRSQKRLMRRLPHLEIKVSELYFNEAHYKLYSHYQQVRHAGGGMDKDGREAYEQFLLTSLVDTYLVEFYVPASHLKNEMCLKMVSVIDVVDTGLSAVYTFFDPNDPHVSWGTYGVLWLIEYAKALGLPYVYLGYWIEDCRKMTYKTRFKPFELLTSQGWGEI